MIYLETMFHLTTPLILSLAFSIVLIVISFIWKVQPLSFLGLFGILFFLTLLLTIAPVSLIDSNSKYVKLKVDAYKAQKIYEENKNTEKYYIQTKSNKLIKTDKIKINENNIFRIYKKEIKDKYFEFLETKLYEICVKNRCENSPEIFELKK